MHRAGPATTGAASRFSASGSVSRRVSASGQGGKVGARVPTRETGGRERGAGFDLASRAMASNAGRGDAPTDATYTVSAWRQTEDDPAPWKRTLAATPEVTLVRGDDSSRDGASTFDASAYYSRLRTRRDGRALLTRASSRPRRTSSATARPTRRVHSSRARCAWPTRRYRARAAAVTSGPVRRGVSCSPC